MVMYNFLNKKYTKQLFILVSLTILILISSFPAFKSGVYNGFDLWFHYGRIEAIAEELANGQFPVRYESSGWYGNGYISSIMYGNIFLYIPAVLHLWGIATYKCYNIYVILVNTAGCLIGLYSFSKLYKDYRVGLLCTIVYMLSGYYITNVYRRAAVGEFTAMIFLPLVVYGLYRIYYEYNNYSTVKAVLPFALGVTGLIESHILSTIMVALSVGLFIILNGTSSVKRIKTLFVGVVLIIGLNAFFIVPFLDSYLSYKFNASVGTAGQNIRGLGLYLNQIFGLFPEGSGAMFEWTSVGEEYARIGIIHVMALLFSVIVFFIFRWNNKITFRDYKPVLFVFLIGVIAAWMSSVYFPWGIFSGNNAISNIIRAVQYPSRYMLIQTICWTVCGGYALKCILTSETKKTALIKYAVAFCILVVVAVLQTGFFMYTLSCRIEKVQTIDRETFSDSLYLQTGTVLEKLSSEVKVVYGTCKVTDLGYKKGKRYLQVSNGLGESKIILPILDYKYISAKDNKGDAIEMTKDVNHRYSMLVEPDFSDTIEIGFTEPWHWRVSEVISLFSILIVFLTLIRKETTK